MQTKHQKLFKKVSSESLLTGSILAAFIVATPYFFYLYEGFPNVIVWKTSIFGYKFVYDSVYYQSVNVVAWILFGKVIPLFLLLIWFFTCKHWWYHAILVPICMYVVQIFLTLKDDGQIIDSTSGILFLAPIILIMFIFLYQIRMKIFDKIHNIDFSELNRVTLKGEIKEENKKDSPFEASYSPSLAHEDEEEYEEDDDNEPLYMG
jgi:hypothetical protein